MCNFSANVTFDTATYGRTNNRYKTRDAVKTYLNVTFEDLLKRSHPRNDRVRFPFFSNKIQKISIVHTNDGYAHEMTGWLSW